MRRLKRLLIKSFAAPIDVACSLRPKRDLEFDLTRFDCSSPMDDMEKIYSDVDKIGNDMRLVIEKYGDNYDEKESRLRTQKSN